MYTSVGINHSSQQYAGLRSIILKERNKLLQQMCDHFFTTICTYVVNFTTQFLQDKCMLKHTLLGE